MKKTRKIISLLLSILMIITSVPLMAVESFAAINGTTGDCTWTLDSDGVLTISGNGKMANYSWKENKLWGTSITRVVIENGVTSIGEYAFYDCASLTSATIPDSVTSIGYSAFKNCTSLTSVTIGNGVTSIGDYAFSGCTSLTSITIPDSVTEIGWRAFDGCTSLTSVIIPDSVTEIDGYAFCSCTSLTSVTIGNGVTSIGDYAFSGCTSLTSVTINSTAAVSAFSGNTSIENIIIGDSVTSIGKDAFKGCTSLTSVTIPDSVTSIGDSVFNCCRSLTSVTIPDGVTSIDDLAFCGCTSLTSVTIGNGVTSIGEYAFSGCTSLTSITIPDSVTSIGDRAFEDCTSLTSVTIPDSVTEIGSNPFKNTPYYNDESNWENGLLYIGNYLIETKVEISDKVEIKQGTKVIAGETFAYRRSLESVTIPDSVTSIGDRAFEGCTSLTSVTIPDSVTRIGEDTFRGCTSLTSIIIPDSVTRIGGDTFRGCTSLASVTIGNGVTSIGDKVFYGCTSLTSVTIGKGATSIGDRAFEGCTSLTSVTIPDSVTSIDKSAFYDCTSLTSVTIPDSVTSIGDSAFYNTAYYNNESNWDNEILYIGKHLIKAKENVSGSVEIKRGTKVIADKAFRRCTSLTSVKIPDSVTSIDKSAFYDCTSLTSVTIPDSVTSIGYEAFSGCTSLKRVYIPDAVTTIGESAFACRHINGFTVIGNPGSAAQAYAEKNGFAFVSPESIKVSKRPNKLTYCIGDAFDPTGIIVSCVNNDGSEDVINAGLSITGFDSSVLGKNTITVAYDGKTTTFDVEIEAPSIALSESNLAFDRAGATSTLTATAVPSDAEIVWKSSNESVATVEDGVVTAKGAGNATITAKFTYNNIEYTATCNVTVEVPTVPTVTFPDVASNDWYYNAVRFNVEKGYVTGYSNGTFGPSNNIQRQDFVLILARIAGADLSAYEGQNGGFSDVQAGAYYASAVAWAKDKGIVTGYSADNFGVGTYITREQISLILCRYLNGSASGDVDTILNAYSDGGNTSPWAKAGVAWAVENGIIGNSDYLNPNGNAGRAEVAQIIYNMSNKGML